MRSNYTSHVHNPYTKFPDTLVKRLFVKQVVKKRVKSHEQKINRIRTFDKCSEGLVTVLVRF